MPRMILRAPTILFLAAAVPAASQTTTQAPPRDVPAAAGEDLGESEEIVVTAGRPTGSALGDLRPEVTLSPAAIRSFGVSSVSDLLTELGPQLRSTRGSGRPVVLLNGRRTSGFGEVRNIPAEAILRAEVLPEEAALRYGFPADQRVLNIVLRPRFRAWTGEVEGGVATGGGAGRGQIEATYFRVTRDGRLNLSLNAETTGDILESQRGIVATGPTPPFASLTPFRTLAPAADQLSANLVWNRGFVSGMGLTLTARAQYDEGLSLNGLPFVATPARPIYTDALGALTQRTSASELGLGATVDGGGGLWRWSVIAGADRTDARTRTAAGLDATAYLAPVAAGQSPPIAGLVTAREPISARSLTQGANVDALLSGPIAELPAGRANLSVKAQAATTDFTGESTRAGSPAETRFGRDILGAQASIDVPVASRRDDVLAAIGDLSVNANVAMQHLSDAGTLSTLGGGFTWSPWRPLQLVGSYTRDDAAPSAQQLAGPVVATPNVPVIDPVTGATVLVTRIAGGTPGLDPSRRRVAKLEANLRPLDETDLTLTAGFTRTRVSDAVAGFPLVTAAIAQAFPERFLRDAFGNLVQVDARAVNFAAQASDVLRWGVNLSLPLGPQPAPRGERGGRGERGERGGDAGASGRPRGGGGPGGGFGGGRGGFGGGGAGRFQAAIYHNWSLTNTVTIRPGLPVLDLLDGGALGQSGGAPRHLVEAQAGATLRGLGVRLNATWTSGTRIDPGPLNPQGALRFSPLTTVNLRLFANLAQIPGLAEKQPWVRGARVSLGVRNVFNQRLRVTDATGATPLAFQPGFIDPVGRSIELSFRKLFFTPPTRGQGRPDGARPGGGPADAGRPDG